MSEFLTGKVAENDRKSMAATARKNPWVVHNLERLRGRKGDLRDTKKADRGRKSAGIACIKGKGARDSEKGEFFGKEGKERI